MANGMANGATAGNAKRRDYGEGSVYQRSSDDRWIGTIEAGWTREGKRRRVIVTAKTRPEVIRKMRAKRTELEEYGDTAWNRRTTVKQWIAVYLERRALPPRALSPNGLRAAASPLNRWVIPTIGHRRVCDLTPGDIRKVAKAQYEATSARGRELSISTVDATQRALMTCLRHAKADGASIPESVFLVPKPGAGKSDRMPLTLEETLKCLEAASALGPRGLRWAFALLYGARQGEVLGLVEYDPIDGHPCIDFDAKVIRLEWQLQPLDYVDTHRKHLGFKISRGREAVHLVKRWHLVRPKSGAGHRELPMIEPIEVALRGHLAGRPANPWGLVFPTDAGEPVDAKVDRVEWQDIQRAAGVQHPSGKRLYHVHECRNFAATELDQVGASDNIAMSLIGHSSERMLRRYQHAHMDAKETAVAAIGQRLGLGIGQASLS